MKTFAFPRSSRLLTPRDYSEVFSDVQIRVPHKHFLILAKLNTLGYARVGLVFSKKNLKHAVQRNRIKRRVRETFRHQPDLPPLDIIVLSRQGLATVANPELNIMLVDLWQRLIRKARQTSLSAKPTTPGDKGAN